MLAVQIADSSFFGHVLMENRNGLIVDAMVTQADGTAERDAALLMLYSECMRERAARHAFPGERRADKAYDTRDFVRTVRDMNIRPHVSQNTKRTGGSAIDGR